MGTTAILYIIDEFNNLAGAERNLFEVVTRLNREVYTSVVVCLQGGAALNSLRSAGVEVVHLDLGRIYSLKAVYKAVWLIKLIRRRHVRIVVTYHDSSDFWGGITAKISGVKAVVSSRRDMGYKLNARHIFFYRFINTWVFARIIAASDAVRAMLIEKQKVPPEMIVTVYNGVEETRFSADGRGAQMRKELGLAPDDFIAGNIASGKRRIKGQEYFVRAAALVLTTHEQAKFMVIGEEYADSEQSEVNPVALARQLGISANFIFLGRRSDIPDLFSAMDVSVQSSLSEGFSNVVIEAMAAGKPVIATSVGGNPEAIVQGKTGLLVPPGNVQALAEAIRYCIEHRDAAREMGSNGRERARKCFSMAAMIRALEDLYANLT